MRKKTRLAKSECYPLTKRPNFLTYFFRLEISHVSFSGLDDADFVVRKHQEREDMFYSQG